MAPSATSTITVPVQETSTVKLTSNTGPYKELAPIGYEKDAELKGKEGHSAAKVISLPEQPMYILTESVSKLPPYVG